MKNGLIVDEAGTKRYYLNDKLHNENGAAVIHTNDDRFWYIDGNLRSIKAPSLEVNHSMQMVRKFKNYSK